MAQQLTCTGFDCLVNGLSCPNVVNVVVICIRILKKKEEKVYDFILTLRFGRKEKSFFLLCFT